MLLLAIWDRRDYDTPNESVAGERTYLRLQIVSCLIRMGRFETAKQHCEELLARNSLRRDHRLLALQFFTRIPVTGRLAS